MPNRGARNARRSRAARVVLTVQPTNRPSDSTSIKELAPGSSVISLAFAAATVIFASSTLALSRTLVEPSAVAVPLTFNLPSTPFANAIASSSIPTTSVADPPSIATTPVGGNSARCCLPESAARE